MARIPVNIGRSVLGRISTIGSCPRICELEQIVDGAEYCPFLFDLVEAPQEELSEASGRLDLGQHGFDDLLSQAVTARRPPRLSLVRIAATREPGLMVRPPLPGAWPCLARPVAM
jgi:hypothetical protein